MASPHDQLFRFTFGQPEHAAPLLRALLPAEVVAAIDWQSLHVVSGSLIDRRLRSQRSDLLLSVQLGGRPLLLYVLVEHKSGNDRWTALQVAGYVIGIWKKLRSQRPRPRRLPPILPLVVHHGPRGFTAVTELRQLVDLDGIDPTVVAALRPWLPQFRFLLASMHGRSEDELRDLSLSLLGKLTLAVMQFVVRRRPVDAVAAFVRWADIVNAVLRAPTGQDAIEAIWSYLAETTKLDLDALEITVERHLSKEARQIMKTTAARWKCEGSAQLLQHLLTTRFGPLPAAITARIQAASVADLERWAIAVLTAPTLDAVFADD